MMETSVTAAALIDAQREHERGMARKRILDGPPEAPKRDLALTPDMVDALTRPVRLEISFDDPMKVREQLEMLSAAIEEAKVLTQQHGLGILRQRLRLRETMKTAADTLTYMNGKTPTGKKKPGAR